MGRGGRLVRFLTSHQEYSAAGPLRLVLDFNFGSAVKRTVVGSDSDLGNGTYEMYLIAGGAYLNDAF